MITLRAMPSCLPGTSGSKETGDSDQRAVIRPLFVHPRVCAQLP